MSGRRDNIGKGEKKTQFGGENANPQSQDLPEANKPWSIKNGLRYFGAQTKKETATLIVENGDNLTNAQMAALKLYQESLKGNVGAVRTILEHVDGKPTQTINLGGQPGNPVRTHSSIAGSSAEEAYRAMLDG